MRNHNIFYLMLVAMLVFVAACGGGGDSTDEPTAEGQEASATATTEDTTENTTPPDNPVSFYLISDDPDVEGGVEFGCGSVAVPVTSTVAATGNLRDDVRAALTALVGAADEDYEGFVNTIDDFSLRVLSVTINAGTSATINLMGSVRFDGDRCLAAQMEAQIVLTVMQFEDIEAAQIALAGRNMRQVFSTRSDLSLVSAYGVDNYLDIINENAGVDADDAGGDDAVGEEADMDATAEATPDDAESADDSGGEETDMDATAEASEDGS